MKKFWDKFAGILVVILLLLSLGLTVGILYLYLSKNIVLDLDFTEHINFIKRDNIFVLYVLISFILLLIFARFAEKFSSRLIFIIGSIIYLVCGHYLIFNVDAIIRTDPKYIFDSAILFNNGDFSALTPGFFDHGQHYLWVYPDQLGLVTFYRVFTMLSASVQHAFIFNLVMILGIHFFQWKIVQLLFDSKKVENLTLFFSFMFLPLFFLTLWIYGDIPGLLFLLIATYCFLKYRKTSKIYGNIFFAILILISLSLACLVRGNYLIFGIALILQLFLDVIKNQKVKNLFLIPVIAMALLLPQKAVNTYYENVLGAEIGKGTPKIAWIAMGLRDEPYPSQAGWWDSYTTFLMTWANDDYDSAEKMAKTELENRINVLKSDSSYALTFFKEKFASTWAEPTIQSLQAGPIVSKEQYTHTPLLKSLYESGKGHKVYQFMTGIYMSCLYLSIILVILHQLFAKKSGRNILILYPLIYTWGGVLFHLVWETKSRYTMPYVYLMIPLFAFGIAMTSDKFKTNRRRKKI